MNDDCTFQRILLVDDNTINLYVLKEVIRLHFPETEILEASSGLEALTIANNVSLDLILMDVKMPDMDGFETAGLIHGRAKTSGIPIIFLSAYDHDSINLKSTTVAGRIHYLTKPIDETKLIRMLHLFHRFTKHHNKCRDK